MRKVEKKNKKDFCEKSKENEGKTRKGSSNISQHPNSIKIQRIQRTPQIHSPLLKPPFATGRRNPRRISSPPKHPLKRPLSSLKRPISSPKCSISARKQDEPRPKSGGSSSGDRTRHCGEFRHTWNRIARSSGMERAWEVWKP